MVFEEMLKEERMQGRTEALAQAILDLLEMLGQVPDSLKNIILSETDMEKLRDMHKNAAKAESIEQFEEALH